MVDLFEPTLPEMVACVEREIKMRESVYPRRVAERKMSPERALRELETMRAVLRKLREGS